MVDQWLGQLSMPGAQPSIVQFRFAQRTPHPQRAVFFDYRNWNRTDLVRLLFEDRWIVLAVFFEQDFNRLRELAVFDARKTTIEYLPEQNRFRIGSRRFDMVEYTPELERLGGRAERMAEERSAV
jgi:hypothetical protein